MEVSLQLATFSIGIGDHPLTRGAKLSFPGAQPRAESFVLEPQARDAEQVLQRAVLDRRTATMHQQRDRVAAAHDPGDRAVPTASLTGQLHSIAGRVDVSGIPAVPDRVDDPEVRVAEQVGQCSLQAGQLGRLALAQDHVRDPQPSSADLGSCPDQGCTGSHQRGGLHEPQ